MGVETHLFVGSSNLESAEYDPDSEDLTLTFQSGARYLYRNVPLRTFRQLQQAPSAGQFFYRKIRNVYGAEEV